MLYMDVSMVVVSWLPYGQGRERWSEKEFVSCHRRLPDCPSCGRPIDASRLSHAAEGSGQVECRRCGNPTSVRAVDQLAREVMPFASYLVGESRAQPEHTPSESVSFNCGACGASLEVEGSSRTVTCGYCGTTGYLPDHIWRRLQPVPTVQPFYLVAHFSEDEYWDWLLYTPHGEEIAAQSSGLPVEIYRRLAAGSEGIRSLLARNPESPPEIRNRLAGDSDREVRERVAVNPNTTADTLDRLATDSEPRVREAVAANPNTTGETLHSMATTDEDKRVRKAIEANPSTPERTRQLLQPAISSSGDTGELPELPARGIGRVLRALRDILS